MSKSSKRKKEKVVVPLFDSHSIKTSFDDILTQRVEKNNYQILSSYTNIKLLLGLVCVAVGTLAQFYPEPFPKSYYPICILLVAYAIASGFLNLFNLIYVKNSITRFMHKGTTYEIETEFKDGQYIITAYNEGRKKIGSETLLFNEYLSKKGEIYDSTLSNALNEFLKKIIKMKVQ